MWQHWGLVAPLNQPVAPEIQFLKKKNAESVDRPVELFFRHSMRVTTAKLLVCVKPLNTQIYSMFRENCYPGQTYNTISCSAIRYIMILKTQRKAVTIRNRLKKVSSHCEHLLALRASESECNCSIHSVVSKANTHTMGNSASRFHSKT